MERKRDKEEIMAIREELQNLNKLSNVIEKRIIAGATIAQDNSGVVLDSETIVTKINIIADKIVDDYKKEDESPVLVSLMDGAFPFASILQRALIDREFDFHYTTMQVGSYEFSESGVVKISSPPKVKLGEKRVIIVDEVWDTGKTFANVKNYVIDCGAKSVDFAVLVDKVPALSSNLEMQSMIRVQPRSEYSCFKLSPDEFLIGFGLDYVGGCRNLLYIGTVDKKTLPTEEERRLLDKIKPLNDRLQQLLSEQKIAAKYASERKSPLIENSFVCSEIVTNISSSKEVNNVATYAKF